MTRKLARRVAYLFLAKRPEDQFGIQTYVFPGSGSTGESPDEEYDVRPSAPKNKQRGLALPSDHRKTRTQKTPGNAVFNVPSDSSDGTKVPVRTLGKPGEEYGHPYKERVDQRRVADSVVPNSATRQHEQKAQALKYYNMYYRRNKSRIKNDSRKRYRSKKRDPREQRRRERYKDPKYHDKFTRMPGSGYREPEQRTQDWRDENEKTAMISRKTPRKKRRKPPEKRKWRMWYRKNKARLKLKAKQYYKKHKFRMKKMQQDRYKNPRKFQMRRQAFSKMHVSILWNDVCVEGFVKNFDPEYGMILFVSERGTSFQIPLEIFLDKVCFISEQDIEEFFDFVDQYDEDGEGDDDYVFASYTFHREQDAVNEDRIKEDPEGSVSWIVPMTGSPGYQDKEESPPANKEDFGEVFESGFGSARVIPRGKNYENKKAALIQDIENKTGRGIRDRSQGIKVQLIRANKKQGSWVFRANDYKVQIKAFSRQGSKHLDASDVKVSCSCDFWRWQGPEYWAMRDDYLLGKKQGTATFPKDKDPQGHNRCCKHVIAVFQVARKYRIASEFPDFRYLDYNQINYSGLSDFNVQQKKGNTMSDKNETLLRNRVIRLAHEKPELRPHLLPILSVDKEASWMVPGLAAFKRQWKYHSALSIMRDNYPQVTYVTPTPRPGRITVNEMREMSKLGLITAVEGRFGWQAGIEPKGWEYLKNSDAAEMDL